MLPLRPPPLPPRRQIFVATRLGPRALSIFPWVFLPIRDMGAIAPVTACREEETTGISFSVRIHHWNGLRRRGKFGWHFAKPFENPGMCPYIFMTLISAPAAGPLHLFPNHQRVASGILQGKRTLRSSVRKMRPKCSVPKFFGSVPLRWSFFFCLEYWATTFELPVR